MKDTDVALPNRVDPRHRPFLAGLAFVIAGAEVFFDGLLGTAARIGLPAFVLTVVVSGFELENLAAGIATNLRGLGNAAAGTFLGGTTFLALGVAGLGATIAPIRASLATAVLVLTAAAPLPCLRWTAIGGIAYPRPQPPR
jgi:Ca2+/Na+ antiporter